MRRHYHSLIALIFLCALGATGFIFWKYAYLVVFQEPQVVVRPLKIRDEDLQRIVDDIRVKAKVQSEIQSKTFTDPFVKPSELSSPQ